MNKYSFTRAVQKASGTACYYCGRAMQAHCPHLMPTRDHIHPRSKGGRQIVWACFTCNHMKGDMTLEQWQAFMGAFPRWWVGVPRAKRKEINQPNRLAIIPYEESMMILRHGKKYWRQWKAEHH